MMDFQVTQEQKQQAFDLGIAILCEEIRLWMEETGVLSDDDEIPCSDTTPVPDN